jgi:hypothetical protein
MPRTGLILVLSFILSANALQAQIPRRPLLFKDGRVEVAAARARGDSAVTLVIAAMPGRNANLASAITGMGGTIRFRDDDVDYLRALVPVGAVERLVGHRDLHSMDVSKPQVPNPTGGSSGAVVRTDSRRSVRTTPPPQDTTTPAWPPVLSDYPLTNRYHPLDDLGGRAFRKDNPTFDGRGVTIAMIDMSADPLLPELQTALTLEGQPTQKIIAYQTAIDYDEQDDGAWLLMRDTVVATSGRFTHRDSTYLPPHTGTFRIDVMDEARFDSVHNAGMEKDLNRDGNPEGSSRLFTVLWDERTNDVWVDTDQDLSFTDETALTDFRERAEFGVLGRDDPDTPVRESVGFGVQIDREKKRIALNMGVARHASLVVGAAVASKGEKGRFEGMAPGARLANMAEGLAAYGQIEATIAAVEHPDVDVVFFEQGSGITRPYLLRDGRLVATVIYDRLIAKYEKVIMVPTHNYPILGGIDDFVLASGAIGVGGHESKDNFFTNHGVRVEHQHNLLITGGYGPMGNGALKPDIISASNYVSTSRAFLEGGSMAGLFQLPPGYTIAGGTSTATPTAAGAVALLISAAKQTGVEYDPWRIKHAITTSARYVPHLPAHKQGNGVIDIGAAWEILQTMDQSGDPVTIESKAPVQHAYSHLLATPHEGVGLYERDRWAVGDRGERAITLTRTTGPSGPMEFTVAWTGDDHATFTAPASVTLERDTPTPLSIGIAPTTPGAHTALLTLTHPDVPGYAHRMLATIVAAQQLTRADSFTVEEELEVPRPGMTSRFFRVSEGTSAFQVEVDTEDRDVALAVIRPDTRSHSGAGDQPDGTVVVNDPMPGVWEVRLSDIADTRTFDWEQAKKHEPVPPTPATLTVSAFATAVESGELPGAQTMSSAVTYDITLLSSMATFKGGASGLPMGSARLERPSIRDKEQLVFDIEVPEGSPYLFASAAGFTDTNADLDVYVFDCTGKRCRRPDVDADPLGDESVLVENPAAGAWRVVVDASSIPSGEMSFEYTDVVFNPSFGTLAVTDRPEDRQPGDTWTATAHSWITDAVHEGGRSPYPAVLIEGHRGNGGRYPILLQRVGAMMGTETGGEQGAMR